MEEVRFSAVVIHLLPMFTTLKKAFAILLQCKSSKKVVTAFTMLVSNLAWAERSVRLF